MISHLSISCCASRKAALSTFHQVGWEEWDFVVFGVHLVPCKITSNEYETSTSTGATTTATRRRRSMFKEIQRNIRSMNRSVVAKKKGLVASCGELSKSGSPKIRSGIKPEAGGNHSQRPIVTFFTGHTLKTFVWGGQCICVVCYL